MSQHKDPNQGEGDRGAARRYDRNLREFIEEGKVSDAADEARDFVESDPAEALAAEQAAKRGPAAKSKGVSVDELVAKGQSLIERVRPMVDRAVVNLRNRFGRK